MLWVVLPLLASAATPPPAVVPDAGCALTVPIKTELSTLDVRGSILGLGLHLDSPKTGASAIGNATIVLERYPNKCPDWASLEDADAFWGRERFSISIILVVTPAEVIIKAGSVPITVRNIVGTIASKGILNITRDGFVGAGALRIVSGDAEAMGHYFNLRSSADSAVRIAGALSSCARPPDLEMSLSLSGAFKSDDLPGSNSHVDIITELKVMPPGIKPSGALIEEISPAAGPYDAPTLVTITGRGLVGADGAALPINVRAASGELLACAAPAPPTADEPAADPDAASSKKKKNRRRLFARAVVERARARGLPPAAASMWAAAAAAREAAAGAPTEAAQHAPRRRRLDASAPPAPPAWPQTPPAGLEKRSREPSGPPSPSPTTIECLVPPGLPGGVAYVQPSTGGEGCGAPRVPFVYSHSPCGDAVHAGCLQLANGAYNVTDCSCACQPGFHGVRCEMCDAGVPSSCGAGAQCVGGDFAFFRGELHRKSYECVPADMPAAFSALPVTVECSARANKGGTCRLQIGGNSLFDPAQSSAIVCEARGCEFAPGTSAATCSMIACDMGEYREIVQSLIGRSTLSGSIAFNCNEAHGEQARCVLTVSDLPIPISADCRVTECVPDETMRAMLRARRVRLGVAIGLGVLALLLVVLLPLALIAGLRKPRTLASTLQRIAAADARAAGRAAARAGGKAAAAPAEGVGAAGAAHVPVVRELRFEALSVTAASGRRILDGVSGVARAGELLGVMGPSGSGKTTLLDVIAGQAPVGALTDGAALLDGAPLPLGEPYPPSLIAYCQQHDLLPATLTVFECVSLAALLTLPAQLPTAAKLKRAAEALEEVSLTHIADSTIGDATTASAQGRVSGGERRRISLAMALVASPAILLCDEVTSGLDSTTAFQMVSTLRALARRGRVVVLSIHQPSSRAFLGLDRLLLMRQGALVLAAPTAELGAICERAGVPCAAGFNLADHLLDVVQGEAAAAAGAVERLTAATSWAPIASAGAERPAAATAAAADDSARAAAAKLKARVRAGRDHSARRQAVELRALFWRAAVSVVRHPSLLRLHLQVALFAACTVGGLFHGLGNDVSGLQNRIGAVFFVLALFGFSGLSAMEVFMGEMALSLREMRNGYYGLTAHLLSKLALDALMLRVVPACAFSAVFYPLANFDPALGHVINFVLIATLVNVAAGTLVAALSVPFDSLGSANLCATIAMLVLLLLNGALLNLAAAPRAIGLLQKLSFFRFGFEAMLGNELQHKVIMIDAPGVDPFPLSANLFLDLLGIDPTRRRFDMLMLLAFAAAHALLAGVLLAVKMRRCRSTCCVRAPRAQLRGGGADGAAAAAGKGQFMQLA